MSVKFNFDHAGYVHETMSELLDKLLAECLKSVCEFVEVENLILYKTLSIHLSEFFDSFLAAFDDYVSSHGHTVSVEDITNINDIWYSLMPEESSLMKTLMTVVPESMVDRALRYMLIILKNYDIGQGIVWHIETRQSVVKELIKDGLTFEKLRNSDIDEFRLLVNSVHSHTSGPLFGAHHRESEIIKSGESLTKSIKQDIANSVFEDVEKQLGAVRQNHSFVEDLYKSLMSSSYLIDSDEAVEIKTSIAKVYDEISESVLEKTREWLLIYINTDETRILDQTRETIDEIVEYARGCII